MIKTKPNESTFHWASLVFLHVRFFCIISWSNPVIPIVINIPPKNDFIKCFLSLKSSVKRILLYDSNSVEVSKSETDQESLFKIITIVATKAKSIKPVCKVSVQTIVLMPPLNV